MCGSSKHHQELVSPGFFQRVGRLVSRRLAGGPSWCPSCPSSDPLSRPSSGHLFRPSSFPLHFPLGNPACMGTRPPWRAGKSGLQIYPHSERPPPLGKAESSFSGTSFRACHGMYLSTKYFSIMVGHRGPTLGWMTRLLDQGPAFTRFQAVWVCSGRPRTFWGLSKGLPRVLMVGVKYVHTLIDIHI